HRPTADPRGGSAAPGSVRQCLRYLRKNNTTLDLPGRSPVVRCPWTVVTRGWYVPECGGVPLRALTSVHVWAVCEQAQPDGGERPFRRQGLRFVGELVEEYCMTGETWLYLYEDRSEQ